MPSLLLAVMAAAGAALSLSCVLAALLGRCEDRPPQNPVVTVEEPVRLHTR